MIQRLLFLIVVLSSITLTAQKYPEFQDPSEWIPLEKSYNYVATSITPRKGQLPEMYSAPIAVVSEKENDIFALKITIDFLKYGFNEAGEEMVQLEGTVDLKQTKNKPVTLEFQNSENVPVLFVTTDEEGMFTATSTNGKLMEFNDYKLKLNFDKIKSTDLELYSKYVIVKWLTRPSDKEMKKLRKRALKTYKQEKKYIDDLRANNN